MYYRLVTDEGRKRKFAYAIGVDAWPQQHISCPKCKREWEKSLMHEFGIKIPVVLSNDIYPDFLWYYIRHVSEKAKYLMVSENVTGFELEEANVLSVNELTNLQKKELKNNGLNINKVSEVPQNYYKMHVKIGAQFHEKSNIVLKDSCSECGYEIYVTKGKEWVDSELGVVLRKDSLNGYDLFMSKGYGETIFCTERFREKYNNGGLTGLLFEEIEVI